jgi:hypothetical protein
MDGVVCGKSMITAIHFTSYERILASLSAGMMVRKMRGALFPLARCFLRDSLTSLLRIGNTMGVVKRLVRCSPGADSSRNDNRGANRAGEGERR